MLKRKEQHKAESRDMSKYVNKQRTLVFSSRGISHRDRHLLNDLRDLMPHSKKDVKLDTKDKLFVINEIGEMKNCNNAIYFETRKKKDLYMWMSRIPNGPSVKFLVQNVHTMAEVKLTGNCLKGSRPMLVFDKKFDEAPHWSLLKEMFSQVLGSPKGHPNTKPFVDHVFSFVIADNRIWFRNYQIVHEAAEAADTEKKEPVLVEIGPRFVLNPVRIFAGSFGGATLWSNNAYVSPNAARALLKRKDSNKFVERQEAKTKRAKWEDEHKQSDDELDTIFQV